MSTPGEGYIKASPDVVIQTGVQEQCAVCLIANVPYELHHIIPRHLGGSNGPVVNLCGGCHQLIHNSAVAMYKGLVLPNLDPKWGGDTQFKFKFLVNVIVRAMVAAEGQQGKAWKYQTTFSDETHTKLVRLAKRYGSQDKAIKLAIDKLHQSQFDT